MSLLVLMYHRAREGRFGNSPEMLDAHFGCIAANHHCVLPGEPLARRRLNVCLSFDDAYYDFHAIVYPLLRKHGLRAVLAVPPQYVVDSVAHAPSRRLGVGVDEAFQAPEQGGLCTWTEIAELAASGLVDIAAHGYSHRRLDGTDVNLDQEIAQPKTVLQGFVGRRIDSFVFPYGRYSARSLAHCRAQYRHVFRIGGAMNRHWNERVLYRIDADQMSSPDALFAPGKLRGYRVRHYWNRLRRR